MSLIGIPALVLGCSNSTTKSDVGPIDADVQVDSAKDIGQVDLPAPGDTFVGEDANADGNNAHADAHVNDSGSTNPCSTSGWCWSNPLPYGHSLRGVWVNGPADVYAVGERGIVLHYDGNTWSELVTGLAGQLPLTAIWGTGPTDIFVASLDGEIWHYDGTAWAAMNSRNNAATRVASNI